MMRTNGYSEALFGGLLWGDSLMRFIFVDEAGRSAGEPVTVVTGIVANADEHVLSAEALVLEALGAVPSHFKEGFVFSAKDVFGNQKYREQWSLTDRLNLLHAMMSVPRKIGMAITLGAQWRGALPPEAYARYREKGLHRKEDADHLHAFALAMSMADRSIRRYAGPREVATVVAENIEEMHSFLQKTLKAFRDNPLNIPPSGLRETVSDREAGYITQTGEMRITRIRNSVHFVGKTEDPLVQVADACAYGFSRFFKQKEHGVGFARAILEDESRLRNFSSPCGAECYWPRPTPRISP
jgi:Protein of unknown function (DUF3800)